MQELAELLNKSFITCNSQYPAKPYIKLEFDDLADAHDFHRLLFNILREHGNGQP